MKRANLSWAEDKTVAMLVRERPLCRDPILYVGQRRVPFEAETTCLGVFMERFKLGVEHTKPVSGRARTKFYKITRLARRVYGVRLRALLLLYKAVFTPIISYAERVWACRLFNTHIKRELRSSQCRVQRQIIGAYSH